MKSTFDVENEELLEQYNAWFSEHYDEINRKIKSYCHNKGIQFKEDYIQQTYLHTANSIIRNGSLDPETLKDNVKTNGYLFIAVRNTINLINNGNADSKRLVSIDDIEDGEKVMARFNAKRDRRGEVIRIHKARENTCSLMDQIKEDVREHFDDYDYGLFITKCEGKAITRENHNQQRMNRIIKYIREKYGESYETVKNENEQLFI